MVEIRDLYFVSGLNYHSIIFMLFSQVCCFTGKAVKGGSLTS